MRLHDSECFYLYENYFTLDAHISLNFIIFTILTPHVLIIEIKFLTK